MMEDWQDQLFEVAAARLFLQQAHSRTLDIKAAHGEPLRHGVLGLAVVFRLPVQLIEGDSLGFDGGDGIPNHTEAAVAEEVDFDQSSLLGGVLSPIG